MSEERPQYSKWDTTYLPLIIAFAIGLGFVVYVWSTYQPRPTFDPRTETGERNHREATCEAQTSIPVEPGYCGEEKKPVPTNGYRKK
jgi:hypothetical protein